EAGIAHGSAGDETTGGIDVILRVFVHHGSGQNRIDYVLAHGLLQIFQGNLVAVLRGDDDGVHARGAAINIFDGDLGFSVGTEEINDILLADFSEFVREAVRELDGHGHQLGRLVASVAEHQTLVAGAAGINAHGDVWRLFVDGADYAAGFGVEAKFSASVANIAN